MVDAIRETVMGVLDGFALQGEVPHHIEFTPSAYQQARAERYASSTFSSANFSGDMDTYFGVPYQLIPGTASKVNVVSVTEHEAQVKARKPKEKTLDKKVDDLRREFELRAPPNTQFVNRRTGLHRKGLVLDTGDRRRSGESNKEQALYVATELVPPEWLEWVKGHPLARNPFLFKDDPILTYEVSSYQGMRLRRYLLYVGDTYYPCAGGDGDLLCSSNNLDLLREEAARRIADNSDYKWWSIHRHSTMEVIENGPD